MTSRAAASSPTLLRNMVKYMTRIDLHRLLESSSAETSLDTTEDTGRC